MYRYSIQTSADLDLDLAGVKRKIILPKGLGSRILVQPISLPNAISRPVFSQSSVWFTSYPELGRTEPDFFLAMFALDLKGGATVTIGRQLEVKRAVASTK